MKCPACGEVLLVIEREAIELDWCDACRGVWFDAGELGLLAERLHALPDPAALGGVAASPSTEKLRRCPRCRRKMDKRRIGGDKTVLIDRCPKHGAWFDAGELGIFLQGLAPGDEAERRVHAFLGRIFGPSPDEEKKP